MRTFKSVGSISRRLTSCGRAFAVIPGTQPPSHDVIKHFLSQFMVSKSKDDSANLSSLYKLTNTDLRQRGGDQYLQDYSGNLPNMVSVAFPDHAWDESQFLDWALTSTPESRASAIKTLQNTLSISNNDDWPKKLSRYALQKSGCAYFVCSDHDL
jgi:hypothetical protein